MFTTNFYETDFLNTNVRKYKEYFVKTQVHEDINFSSENHCEAGNVYLLSCKEHVVNGQIRTCIYLGSKQVVLNITELFEVKI